MLLNTDTSQRDDVVRIRVRARARTLGGGGGLARALVLALALLFATTPAPTNRRARHEPPFAAEDPPPAAPTPCLHPPQVFRARESQGTLTISFRHPLSAYQAFCIALALVPPSPPTPPTYHHPSRRRTPRWFVLPASAVPSPPCWRAWQVHHAQVQAQQMQMQQPQGAGGGSVPAATSYSHGMHRV